ncbi:ribosome biogenesis GTP-binding protein YihA/YsxC [Gammaproteobacteria bacterium]|jgi:GTP-binding protein|nr:ribosome biogenesis GTP-binding protein YihA/YsxC [Gammaproteobacteria bacterium]
MNLTFQYSHAIGPSDPWPNHGYEVAVWGRSNAGKSTFINALTSQKIARSSNTPGRTQMMQVFTNASDNRLVDLPGYGYAKAGSSKSQQWEQQVQRYLLSSHTLQGLFWILDARHPITPTDQMRLKWINEQAFNFEVALVLNKIDKLNQSEKSSLIRRIEQHPIIARIVSVCLPISAIKKTGIKACQIHLHQWLNPTNDLSRF